MPSANDSRTTARASSLLAGLAVALFVFLVSAEFAGYLLLHRHMVPGRVPSYAPFEPKAYTFWEDINEDFGVWHAPNATYRHKKACFDVTYHSNSAGARDPERQVESSKPRVVVLGDSFLEGFGVDLGERTSDVLEARTGLEHLNFATSGYFGPTQDLLLYRSLARTYRHDAVLVSLLPDNDFDDDDIDFGRRAYPDRYRPYLVGSYPDYHVEYVLDDIHKSAYRAPPDTLGRSVADFLGETSNAYNVYCYYRDLQAVRARITDPNQVRHSRYYEFREDEILRLRYVMEQLVKEAAGRPLTVLGIPTRRDLETFGDKGEAPLSRRMQEMSREVGFRFVDMLPVFGADKAKWPDYYLPCDGHWSPAGHAAAAGALLDSGFPSLPAARPAAGTAAHSGSVVPAGRFN